MFLTGSAESECPLEFSAHCSTSLLATVMNDAVLMK
jgi:hypothetical protein